MRKIGAVLALVVFTAVPAIAAQPPKPPKGNKPNPNLTVKVSATSVTFGRSVTFTGTTKNIPAGTSLELQQNPYPYGGLTASGKTAVVAPDGSYSLAGVVPGLHTQYLIRARTSPPTDSGTVFVRVRLRASFRVSDSTPKRGQRVRFYGTVAPEHDGKPVLIQKRTATGYRTVARTVLADNGTATSKYSRRLRIRRSGVYRVVVQSVDQDHDDGVSRARRLRVH